MQTIQMIFLGFNIAANAASSYLSYRLFKIPEVMSSIWMLFCIFFAMRVIPSLGSAFFVAKLQEVNSVFGSSVTISSWIYSAVTSMVGLAAVTIAYKTITKKFPWTR